MNMQLIGDRIAVKLDEAEGKSGGGIILVESAKEKPMKGTVVAVGLGKWSERNTKYNPIPVVKGSRVIIEKYGRQEIEVDGETVSVIHEEDIIAVIPNEEKAAKKK